jgi:pilus assembly protein Flp/PilA
LEEQKISFYSLRRARADLTTSSIGDQTMSTIKNFFMDESGLELSEYAVAAALIALAVITAFTDLGTAIATKITALKDSLK